MIRSMTGFAAKSGVFGPFSWDWELRAVNGKGLDMRLRVPDWITGLEVALRKQMGGQVLRGNVTASLRLSRESGSGKVEVNAEQLDVVLAALQQIEARAMDAGVSLAPSKASDILPLRGVLEQAVNEDDPAPLLEALLLDFAPVLAAFNEMRAGEGAALGKVLAVQLDEIAALTQAADDLAQERSADLDAALRRNLARVVENTDGIEPGRIAQELALIAVKSDITEELDRLRAHVEAARALIAEGGAVGRKLDFLMQEFNREANTLCSKAQHKMLTAIGLDLKAVIDQMREQVQNVE
ncbi:MAG: YicC/YloC family endoribonuclease [Sulfitobacter sp.]